jgi:multiple sugar transport system substrate-binding protein
MKRITGATVGAALILASHGARAADLVVWWDEGFYPQEAEAVREIVGAFEQETRKQVEIRFYPEGKHADAIEAALGAGQPPDFAFGIGISSFISKWALNDRLVDLTESVGAFSNLFDPDSLASWMLLNQKMGKRGLYALPMGRTSNHIHIWTSLLQQAGFALEDIPAEWDGFWSFWCDQVQPALRRATGRDDIWGVGLGMSDDFDSDTWVQFYQFMQPYAANYVTSEGHLVIDDPEIRRRIIKAVESYTSIYRSGCTPPDSASWAAIDNNKAFLDGRVVMTLNNSLSIPNALRNERPDDYYENTATIEWPLGPDGEAFPIKGVFYGAAVFKEGGHLATAKEFVRFLVAEGWLGHYLDFSGERMLPPMPKLLDAPFWLDPSDRHRMAAVMQIASRPTQYDYVTASGDWRYDLVLNDAVWEKAVHRVAAEGISPEQAVDEAIARIKEILSE